MISKECFTRQWIEAVRDRFHYPDVNLIEKVIRAFSVVEMLSESGCPFIWKGGSCLMLLLGSDLHRLSIDVDIVCPPSTDIEGYLAHYADYGFLGRETVEREQRESFVPKSHQKLHYRVAYLSKSERTESILLDVLYEDVQYARVERLKIESPFLLLEGAPGYVNVPSVNDILGDKLTAFAPNTSGIPYYKNGSPKFVEIIKQLYDIGRLFDNMTDLDTVAATFRRIVPIELSYRHLPSNPFPVYADIRGTALCLATRGKEGAGDFAALQNGVSFIRPFMYRRGYYIEDAILDGAKAAYLATAIETGAKFIRRYDGTVPELPSLMHGRISKLKRFLPEAFFYWIQVEMLLLPGNFNFSDKSLSL
jgi:hypothetical protein